MKHIPRTKQKKINFLFKSENILKYSFVKKNKTNKINLLVCGGGRKNLTLIENIRNKLPNNINLDLIDDYNINGDFIESQAFAYLAIRSLLKKEISFVKTTNVKKSCTGGILVKNY